MSLVSDAMAEALAAVSDARGESLSYRATTSGAWTALTGFVLDWTDGPNAAYEDRIGVERTAQAGTLAGPITPALAVGYQVRDASGNVWSIKAGNNDGQQQIWTVEDVTLGRFGPDRGRTR